MESFNEILVFGILSRRIRYNSIRLGVTKHSTTYTIWNECRILYCEHVAETQIRISPKKFPLQKYAIAYRPTVSR